MGPEADDVLSNFVTGMDDLFNRRIYTFENDQSLTVNKKKLEVKGLGEKLGSRNQPLKKTVNNVDTKLATLLPAYRSFFFEEKNIADPKKKWKSNLKISDLDLMIILKRSSKKLDILRTIQEARQDYTTLSMLQIQKLQRLHKELTSFCEQRYDDKDQKKHLTTVELEHLTAADKLYIQMEIERITNCTMLADLLKNIREFPGARSDVMFADPASIILFSRCFELGNIYNRTEVLDRSFQGFQDSLMLLKNPSIFMMDTLESGVQRSLKDMNIDTIDASYFERWKKVYEEEMDCWSNWIFPIFTSCFCVVLSKNIKEEQSNLKKNDAKEVSIMYRDHAHVQKEDIIDALLKVVYNLRKTDCEEDPQERQMIAVHEAAHAVVGEVLHSGSIGIITIRGSHGAIGGMESGFAVYAKSEEEFQDEIIKTLAGKAGTALIYGIMDIRAAADIKKADQLLDIWLCHFAGGGFSGVEPSENRLSEPRLSYNEAIKSAKLEELYRRAYKILYDNRDFLLAVQKELLEHETLLNSDLAKIRESCT